MKDIKSELLNHAQDLFKAELDYLEAIIDVYDKLGMKHISLKEFVNDALNNLIHNVEVSDEFQLRHKPNHEELGKIREKVETLLNDVPFATVYKGDLS